MSWLVWSRTQPAGSRLAALVGHLLVGLQTVVRRSKGVLLATLSRVRVCAFVSLELRLRSLFGMLRG